MIGSEGAYEVLPVKGGNQVLKSRRMQSDSKTLTTTTQDGTDIEIPSLGDVAGFIVGVTASATGTLTGAQKLCKAVSQIRLRDRSGKVIIQNVIGTDLNYLHHLTNGNGKKLTETDVSATAATDTYFIQWNVDQKDLPAKIQITFAPYSDMATSGATGGSATVRITVLYRDGVTNVTHRVNKIAKNLASGTNTITSDVPRDRVINRIGIKVTEASLTSVLLSRDGGEEVDMVAADLASFLDTDSSDAHVSGYLIVPCTPFTANDKTRLEITMGSADSAAAVYFFMLD